MVDAHLVDAKATFSSFSHLLDARLLRALADMGFARPTLVQSKAIPLALEGRDILARARTGSGKTAAYCIPVVQKILSTKSTLDLEDLSRQATRCVILVPTRELSEQVSSYLKGLCKYCEDIVVANAAGSTSPHLQRTLLSDKPDIVIATPARGLALFQSKSLVASHLDSLVIDEADLVLSYGHDDDIRQIFSGAYLPKVYQSFLMSATMTEDVELLKGLTLRNPAILKLEDGEDEAAHLSQYAVKCSEIDKFLLTYVILKLKLVRGKSILFVNDVDRSYRLKLFLEQFSIKSCVLNSELPLNSRYHTVQEFNKGVYDYIIATDESDAQEKDEDEDEEEGNSEDGADDEDEDEIEQYSKPQSQKRTKSQSEPSGKTKSKKSKHDKEYGVTRGIDFIDVACVLNFDLPSSSRSYTHRVGRTARAGRTGMALSFVVPRDQWGKNKVVGSLSSAQHDEKVFSRIEKEQGARGSKLMEYKFDMKQVEAFRYRMEDALRSVTRSAVREARIKELKEEVLNSDRLKAHFEDNPLDLEYLRHDKPLHPTRIQPHMKHVPKYLLPKTAPAPVPGGEATGVVEAEGDKNGRVSGRGGMSGRGSGRGGKKKSDPLKKFGR
ncbi:P-loop containing nucleoside triphosphate hydrolase protein [Lentinula aff. lateritia]|uniref:P-loop containing nucleoside triphosphate hydrolase protein n=1 Tax=Lentinula aff. lateritia TaxID=2804960 RepID=A0ACC1THS1_9AGAR|nr:P-loop containing nucleoside triphosphate hydrolase protein [Lentinula aff. lateritia]